MRRWIKISAVAATTSWINTPSRRPALEQPCIHGGKPRVDACGRKKAISTRATAALMPKELGSAILGKGRTSHVYQKNMPARGPVPLIAPKQPIHAWSAVFRSGALYSASCFRFLNGVDDDNRESLVINVHTSPADQPLGKPMQ